jgi:hypothetical protein
LRAWSTTRACGYEEQPAVVFPRGLWRIHRNCDFTFWRIVILWW